MPGQVPGMGRGPVFQPKMPPPFSSPFAPGSAVPQNTGDTGGGGAPGRVSPTHGKTGGYSPGTEAVRLYWVAWTSPANLTTFILNSVPVTATGTSYDTLPMTMQFQSASDLAFTLNLNTTELLSVNHNVSTGATLGPFSNLQTVYFRARVGIDPIWSEWSTPVRVTIDASVAQAYEYVDQNVGIEIILNPDGREYVDQNVGIEIVLSPDGREYVDEFVNTDTPTPVIWAIRPTAGKAGDGVTLLGSGFGSSQAEFSGLVESQDPATGTWTTVPVVGWARNAATANAYTASRKIEPYTPTVDPQHDAIDITVPSGAKPPTLNLRVRTDGP